MVAPRAGDLTSHFYALLFLREPALRDLFPPAMDTQRDRLVQALVRIVGDQENAGELSGYLGRLGRDHRKYDVLTEHYALVGECLIAALARYSGDAWNRATADAWGRAYHERRPDHVRRGRVRRDRQPAALDGGDRRARTPRRRHRRGHRPPRTPVPVPGRPVHHRRNAVVAARLAAVLDRQRTRRPRPADIPRPRRTGGWVSNALVHKAHPGDRIKPGPAQGEMVLDHFAPHPVLCVGGGTGIGAAQGDHRRDRLRRLAARRRLLLRREHPQRPVRPRRTPPPVAAHVLVQGPPRRRRDMTLAGISGAVAEVLSEYGPRYDCDAYLSGPPEMVRDSARVLRRLGLPSSHIHHDPVAAGFGQPGFGPPGAADADDLTFAGH
ncbi:globin domain-containing protein [Yinghuangia aomiensis]